MANIFLPVVLSFETCRGKAFQYKFDKASAWRLAFQALMANQHLKNLRLRRFINQRFEKNFLPFAVNQRLKIYVFAVFRACGNAIFMANIFC